MKRASREQIGILGGTFNPIHLGHLLIAQDALEQCQLTRVKFIPCSAPPHKRAPTLVPAQHRLRMIKLAIAGNDRFEVDDLEIRRGGHSYSVETITQLRGLHPRADFHFIIGADSYCELHLWRDIERLAILCTFIVLARPGFEPKNRQLPPKLKAKIIHAHQCEISSTEIRKRIAQKQSICYFVHDTVRHYIARHKLYQ